MIKFPSPVCVGLDPSTYTGVVALKDGNLLLEKTLHLTGPTGFERASILAASLKEALIELQKQGKVTVFMEGFAYGNKFSLVTMVEISTSFKAAMFSLGIDWYTVQPSQLKKWTTRHGASDKTDMAQAVQQRWGFTPTKVKGIKTDDVVDAYALARMCNTLLPTPHESMAKYRG